MGVSYIIRAGVRKMEGFIRRESQLKIEDAVYQEVVMPGDGWLHELSRTQTLRITDLEGNQAVDTIFFRKNKLEDHYSAIKTITMQENIYLTTGSILRAESGVPLLEITADLCGRHDTLGGACASQSNTVRYSREKAYMHNCRDTFLLALAEYGDEIGKRDLVPNVNFFMNVPITEEGELEFVDGVSGKGCYVELKALEDVVVLISNCTQMNNPCNDYNPTPIQLTIWDE